MYVINMYTSFRYVFNIILNMTRPLYFDARENNKHSRILETINCASLWFVPHMLYLFIGTTSDIFRNHLWCITHTCFTGCFLVNDMQTCFDFLVQIVEKCSETNEKRFIFLSFSLWVIVAKEVTILLRKNICSKVTKFTGKMQIDLTMIL